MFITLTLNTEKNLLLCSPCLVGNGELVEVYAPDEETPPNSCGRILKKINDNSFEVYQAYDGHAALGMKYSLGERCVLQVLYRNNKGKKKRNFPFEEQIVNIDKEHAQGFILEDEPEKKKKSPKKK